MCVSTNINNVAAYARCELLRHRQRILSIYKFPLSHVRSTYLQYANYKQFRIDYQLLYFSITEITSTALYGAETWTLREGDQKLLRSSEIWC